MRLRTRRLIANGCRMSVPLLLLMFILVVDSTSAYFGSHVKKDTDSPMTDDGTHCFCEVSVANKRLCDGFVHFLIWAYFFCYGRLYSWKAPSTIAAARWTRWTISTTTKSFRVCAVFCSKTTFVSIAWICANRVRSGRTRANVRCASVASVRAPHPIYRRDCVSCRTMSGTMMAYSRWTRRHRTKR